MSVKIPKETSLKLVYSNLKTKILKFAYTKILIQQIALGVVGGSNSRIDSQKHILKVLVELYNCIQACIGRTFQRVENATYSVIMSILSLNVKRGIMIDLKGLGFY